MEEEGFLTKKDFMNIMNILQVTGNRERASDDSIRLQRMSRVLASLGPNSLHAVDKWLDYQENGKAGALLFMRSGEDDDTHVVHPEAACSHIDSLTRETLVALGLHKKPLRRRRPSSA